MMSKSLQINGQSWNVSVLGEQALLLKPQAEEIPLSLIHQTMGMLEKSALSGVIDFIPSYESIAIIYDRLLQDMDTEIDDIQKNVSGKIAESRSFKTHKVPVCYEVGLDWAEVEKHTGLTRKQIIQKHSKAEYTVAMMGFMPGFVYLSGMDVALACPRKDNPRTQIPAGAVGIAGAQTGIYSLESPGGWQIIGRTPHSFFDLDKDPPTNLNPGDALVFEPISKEKFEQLETEKEAS